MDDTPTPKPPKAKPGRKPSEVRKQALNLRLEVEVVRRLKVYALLSGSTVSDVVSELARQLAMPSLEVAMNPKNEEAP